MNNTATHTREFRNDYWASLDAAEGRNRTDVIVVDAFVRNGSRWVVTMEATDEGEES